MAVILFIDMLGARKRWRSGGVAESMPAFYRFKKMVNIAARRAPAGEILDGVIETDAAMLVCGSIVEAAGIQDILLTAILICVTSVLMVQWVLAVMIRHRVTISTWTVRIAARNVLGLQTSMPVEYAQAVLLAWNPMLIMALPVSLDLTPTVTVIALDLQFSMNARSALEGIRGMTRTVTRTAMVTASGMRSSMPVESVPAG